MNDNLDKVRATAANLERVDMGDTPIPDAAPSGPASGGPSGPGDASGPGGPGDADPFAPMRGEAARLMLNDLGNAGRLGLYFGQDILFVPRVGWFVWAGTHWKADPDRMAVRRLAHRLPEMIAHEARTIQPSQVEARIIAAGVEARAEERRLEALAEDDRTPDHAELLAKARADIRSARAAEGRLAKARARHLQFATATGNAAKLTAAIDVAEPAQMVPLDRMDVDPLCINTLSGVLVFRRPRTPGEAASVECVPHDRDQRLSKVVRASWDPAAPAPRFRAFLDRVQPDALMQAFLQRWLGYSMSGLTGEQKLAYFHGEGANGKSVMIDLVARILGDYAATAKIESLIGRNRRSGGDATPDLVPLIGARFVRASEPEEGERLQEGKIKELTGGEPILVRALHADFIEITPKFKLTISGNHKPEIRGDDEGIWRRVMLVPWSEHISEEERDQGLVEKLWEERDGVLAWLARGLADYLTHGLDLPDEVLAATKSYRDASDPVAAFLVDCCEVSGSGEASIPARELQAAFNLYLLQNGQQAWRPRTIALRLADKAARWRHPVNGFSFRHGKTAGVMHFHGIRLLDHFRRKFDAAPKDASGFPTGLPPETGGAGDGASSVVSYSPEDFA